MEQKSIIYKIDSDNKIDNILSDLKIIEYLPIHDNGTNNKLIVNKLGIGQSGLKLFIETSYLKVLAIDENKLYLKLTQSHIDFFDSIDDKCAELLGELVNGESELDITELYGQIDLMGYNNVENFSLEGVEYKSLIDTDTNIMKINIFSNTTIKQSEKNISSSKISPGDDVRLVIGLDYISLLIDKKNLLARTKIYSYFIDVSKNYTYVPSSREKIDKWEFTSNKKTDIFIKTNITENDNFNVNSEVYNQTKPINFTGGNKLKQINESEKSDVSNIDMNQKNDLENLENLVNLEHNSDTSSDTSSIGQCFKNNDFFKSEESDNINLGEPDNVNLGEQGNINLGEQGNINLGEPDNVNLGELGNVNLGELGNVNLGELGNVNLEESDNIDSYTKLTASILYENKIEKPEPIINKNIAKKKTIKKTTTSKKKTINIDTNENINICDNNEKVIENKKLKTRATKKITKETDKPIEGKIKKIKELKK
jgi:hypothetical protein